MKVNDSNSQPVGAAGSGKALAAEGVGTGKGTLASGQPRTEEDNVQLSRLSGHLREIDQNSPSRIAYTDQLQAAVANGSYQVNDVAVGRKMIEDSLSAGTGN